MKLCTFAASGRRVSIGAVDVARGSILDLQLAAALKLSGSAEAFSDMLALIDGLPLSLQHARELEAAGRQRPFGRRQASGSAPGAAADAGLFGVRRTLCQ